MSELEQAVATVIRRCLRVQAAETVLVVADPASTAIGEALLAAARDAGGDAVLTILPPNPARGTEPPAPVAAALAAADVFIAPCLPSLSHASARKRACELGHRGATMPGVTADMLARLMSTDFDALTARSRAVATLLSECDEARLTCPRGTDPRHGAHRLRRERRHRRERHGAGAPRRRRHRAGAVDRRDAGARGRSLAARRGVTLR